MTYKVNHEAFSIQGPERDYWCGFICADGSIARGNTSPILAVQLAKRDEEHLHKLKKFLGSQHPVLPLMTDPKGFGGRLPACRLRITSKELVRDLDTLCMGVKSLGRVAHRELSNSRDFWRGVIDGDGTVMMHKQSPYFYLCGGKDLLEQFKQFCFKIGIKTNATIRSRLPIYLFGLTGRAAKQLIGHLYQDGDVALTRKSAQADKIKNWSPSTYRGFSTIDPEKLKSIRSAGGKAAHAKGVAYRWTSQQAKAASLKAFRLQVTRRLEK